jgi:hypothetical protein
MRDASHLARFFPLLAAVLIASCTPTATPAVTVVRTAPGDKVEEIKGDAVKLKRGSQEPFSGARPGFYVVRSQEDWERAWPTDKVAPMPPLDTASQMFFMAVSDTRNVTKMKVHRALETATFMYVWVRETKVGEGCTNKSQERAFDAVLTARADKPVKFFVDEERGESCGDPPSAGVECRLKNQQTWANKITAQPGETVECTLSASARGRFELVDKILSMTELPPGSTSKLIFRKGSERAEMELDVYGTYMVMAEAADEVGRRGRAAATIEVKPPKTKDVLVQLAWAGFDRTDMPDTFPRVNLRVAEEGPKGQRCSAEIPVPGLCDVKTRGAYTYMRVPAGARKLPVSIQFLDERVEKGPGPCVHVWYDGERTAEHCDRKHRDADEVWKIGVLDTTTGKIQLEEASATPAPAADAGAAPAPEPTPKAPAPPAPKKK